MASHAIINLCPRQACLYLLFHFMTTWYYSLTLHWFLYHHFFMIPWLHDSIFPHSFYILSCLFLAPQTLYHIQVRHLRWATLYTWYFVLYHIDYVPVAIIFTGEYTQTLYHIRVQHLSYHIYRFRHAHFASWSHSAQEHTGALHRLWSGNSAQ